jgi:hypothetical protein
MLTARGIVALLNRALPTRSVSQREKAKTHISNEINLSTCQSFKLMFI